MHAAAILQKILRVVISQIDVRNVRTLLLAVESLLRGRRLTRMELARHFPNAEHVHAPLKRPDRFIGNPALHAIRRPLYGAAARWVLRNSGCLGHPS